MPRKAKPLSLSVSWVQDWRIKAILLNRKSRVINIAEHSPLPHSVRGVQPPLEFIPQSFHPLVLQAVQAVVPVWLKAQLSIDSVQVDQIERLIHLYQQFEAGKVRFLLAFRHPSTADPFVMAHLLWKLVPRAARKQGIPLQRSVHSYFIYDRGIPLWAGNFVSWLFPRLGGTSIHRGKADRLGLKAARDLFANGRFPIAVAPEGATNDHSEIVSPLEPGVAQLGFWCQADLLKAGRQGEEVLIVPIGIKYRYLSPPWDELGEIMTQLERTSGLAQDSVRPPGYLADPRIDALYGRLLRLGNHGLDVMEDFYQHYYHRTFPQGGEGPEAGVMSGQHSSPNAQLVDRLQSHLQVALEVAEEYFGLQPNGNLVDRCRRLEQAGWDRIYRHDLEQLTDLERGLANLLAEEASLRLWHMRIVERLLMITGDYILQNPSAERFAEILLIVWKIISFVAGDSPHQPPDLWEKMNSK